MSTINHRIHMVDFPALIASVAILGNDLFVNTTKLNEQLNKQEEETNKLILFFLLVSCGLS